MALSLVVEDGFGLTNSNSYITLQDFQDYWELRNDSSVAALSDEAATAAIVQAAQYMDFAYRWIGDRYNTLQAMSWPRVVFFDRDFRAMYANVIPQRLKDAQCELAREAAINGPLAPALERAGRISSESIGPLSISYFSDAPGTKEFPLVESILADLVEGATTGNLTSSAILS